MTAMIDANHLAMFFLCRQIASFRRNRNFAMTAMIDVLIRSKHRVVAGTKREAGVDVNDARLGISYKGPWL